MVTVAALADRLLPAVGVTTGSTVATCTALPLLMPAAVITAVRLPGGKLSGSATWSESGLPLVPITMLVAAMPTPPFKETVSLVASKP